MNSRPIVPPCAVGRGRFRPLLPLLVAVAVGTVGCQPVRGGPESPAEPSLPAVSLERAPFSNDEARAALELVRQAETALRAGDTEGAVALASRIVEEYPATPSAGQALWVRAQALGTPEAGADQAIALEDLQRLVPLLGVGDPRHDPATLLLARVLSEAGRTEEAIAAALSLGANSEVSTRDFAWMREVVPRLDAEALERVVRDADVRAALVAPVLVARARALGAEGAGPEARQAAQAALDAGAFGPDREGARAILDGEGIAASTTLAERIPIAAILPTSGSPALRRFAEEVRDGLLAAITASGLEDRVEVEIYDDGGDAARAAELMATVEEAGVFGVVGPLQDGTLGAAVAARTRPVPVVSPTAFFVPQEGDVYSLASLDPQSARALAEWASEAGISTASMIHPSDEASIEEARIFRETFEAAGGVVLQELVYAPGLTFFQDQIRSVAASGPDALVLPVPPADVEALAPQVTFYGLDTLGIQVLGTSAWTDAGVRDAVSERHLSGVVVASPDVAAREGYDRFVDAYEARFRRSLFGAGGAPAGYDAASLLLTAAQSGARSPAQMAEALQEVRDFPGATGRLSIEDGKVIRRHGVFCYQGAEPAPIRPGRPVLQWRGYPPPTDTTDTVPPGPGRRAGFACPGTAAADSARARFFREGGDSIYPDLASIYRRNDILLARDTVRDVVPDTVVPGR